MKKIVFLMLVIAITVFTFASCGECEHIDSDSDGKCDECGANVDESNNPDAPVTEDEWEDAFDFSNVTLTTKGINSNGETYTQNYRFVGDRFFVGHDGEWREAPDGYSAYSYTYVLDFSDKYDKFTYDNGVYKAVAIDLDTSGAGIDGVEVTAENIVVTITNGKVTSVKYSWTATEDGETDTGEYEFTLTNHGTTEAPVIEELLTEDEWEAAFDFENVTIYLEEGKNVDEIEDVGTLYVYDGDWYMEYDGQVVELSVLGMKDTMVATIDFSDYYDDFEYNNGKYVCALIEANIPLMGDVKFKNIEIAFDGKQIDVISYVGDDGNTVDYSRATFGNYGTTEEPDVAQPDSATNATYNGNGLISFEYPDNFTRDNTSGSYINDGIYSSNFNVQGLPKTDEFDNITAEQYKALLNEQGAVSGMEVVACEFENKNNGTFDILVISISSRMMSLEFTQVQYVVHVGSYTVVISCTAYKNADMSFMETIFNSMAPAIPRTGF